jgi:O-antigen/teichoic acid export membrane protein
MDELFYVAKKATKLIFWATTPIFLCLILFGKPILVLFFGKKFIVSYLPMALLLFGQFINSTSGSTGIFMNMTGHQKVFRKVIFFAALINIALNILLIPNFGMNGAAFSGMVSLCFWNLYVLLYIKKKYGRSIGYMPLLK